MSRNSIDRQSLIDSFKYDDDGTGWMLDDIIYRIEQFPDAEECMMIGIVQEQKEGEPMSDLIDRQAAIDGLSDHYIERRNLNDWQGGWNAALDWVEGVYLDDLPSAQPEIIQCKDCKHYNPLYTYKPYSCSEGMEDVFENDFCSRAERREDE